MGRRWSTERRAHHQQGHAERRPQHGGPADLPEPGPALHRVDRPGGLGGNTNFYKPMLEGVWFWHQTSRCRSACARSSSTSTPSPDRGTCRSSRSCSSAANTASAASTSDRSARRIRLPGLVLGGNKSLLFNVEQNINIAGPVRLILFYDAGQVRDVGTAVRLEREPRRSTVPPRRPFQRFATRSRSRCGADRHHDERPQKRLQDVHRRRSPVLHAGAERPVPPDLRLQPAARRACSTTPCSRSRHFSSASRWGPRSKG